MLNLVNALIILADWALPDLIRTLGVEDIGYPGGDPYLKQSWISRRIHGE